MAGSPPKTAKQPDAHISDKDVVKAVGTLLLVPRSLKGLEKPGGEYNLAKDYLSDFVSVTSGTPGRSPNPFNNGTERLKELEYRYYIDIAQSKSDKWYSHRKITAIVPEAKKPVTVKWEVVSPKGLAGFGTFNSSKEKLEQKTTADGVCEVTVVVALANYDRKKLLADREKEEKEAAEKAKKGGAATDGGTADAATYAGKADAGTPTADAGVSAPAVAAPKPPLEIVIRASLAGATNPESTKELRLVITRNSDVKSLAQIYEPGAKYGKGNHLLVFQPEKKNVEAEADPDAPPPAKPAKPAPNAAVLLLNHVLNQVVPRHGDVDSFKYIRYSGAYSAETRKAVEAFVTKFPSVSPPDWPYNLSNVGVYPSLVPYLTNEYTFDWSKNKGWVVDRHLLISDELCAPGKYAEIDGLYELKIEVVDRLVRQMIECAELYFNCNAPWLHRPEDSTYTPGAPKIEMVEGKVEHVQIYGDDHKPISVGGKPRVFLRKERRVRVDISADGNWHKIRLDAGTGTGWVKDDEVAEVLSVKEDPAPAKGKKAPPPVDRDVYDAPAGKATGTKLKPKERVPQLDTQEVTAKDGTKTSWCEVPVRLKNQDVWLKDSEVKSKQVVTLTGKVQIYENDGQPTTKTEGKKKVPVTETGEHDFIGEELIAPPPPPNAAAAAAGDGGVSDAGVSDAGSKPAVTPDAGSGDAGSAGDGGTPKAPPPPPIAFYRISLGSGKDTLVKKSDAGVKLKRLILPPPPSKANFYAAADTSKPLLDQYGKQITGGSQPSEPLYMGRTIEVLDEKDDGTDLWFKIHANITTSGWIKEDSVEDALTDDRSKPENLGNYGSKGLGSPAGNFGVAYSFGCKNMPGEFEQRMQVISPPDTGKFTRHRISGGTAVPGDIVRWDEYSISQRVGLYEKDLHDPELPRDWAGIDCSGFAQNCTTYATFRPDGPERIVPNTVLWDLEKTPTAEVGASGAIGKYVKKKGKEAGAYARQMDFVTGTDGETHFLRGGDILTTSGHIVIVDGTADEIVLLPPPPPPPSKAAPGKPAAAGDGGVSDAGVADAGSQPAAAGDAGAADAGAAASPKPTPPPKPDPLSLSFLQDCKKAVNVAAYKVVNAFGVDRRGPAYTRKTIRMPQDYWTDSKGNALTLAKKELTPGRIFIWH